LASYAPQPDYMTVDDDLIKPKKLINPVKASKSHQELHRELLMNQKRYEDTLVYSRYTLICKMTSYTHEETNVSGGIQWVIAL